MARHLKLVHVSDPWRDRWAHTSVGRDVDPTATAAALRAIRYTGPTVYELIDMEPVEPRISRELDALRAAGWALEAEPSLPRPHGERIRSTRLSDASGAAAVVQGATG